MASDSAADRPPSVRGEGAAFDLERFVQAQDPVLAQVLDELRAGHKRSHWIWFVFPQLAGLGRSAIARHYGLADLAQARAYGTHPVLGPRLRICCEAILAHPQRSAHAILGSPDDLKLCSCATLFERALPEEPVFGQVLTRFYGGTRDAATLALLEGRAAS